MRAIDTFFTNGGRFESPKLGVQPASVHGLFITLNGYRVPEPPSVNDPSTYPRLERYVKDVMTTLRQMYRILLWCLYNEPENFKQKAYSSHCCAKVFRWAREVNPSQPLSSPIWIYPGGHGTRSNLPIISFLGENCGRYDLSLLLWT